MKYIKNINFTFSFNNILNFRYEANSEQILPNIEHFTKDPKFSTINSINIWQVVLQYIWYVVCSLQIYNDVHICKMFFLLCDFSAYNNI